MRPADEVELAFVKSILNAEGLHHLVSNEHFGGLYVGPQIELYNSKAVLVEREDEERARDIISPYCNVDAEFIDELQHGDPMPPDSMFMRIVDKVRLVFEVLLFGWLVPRHRKSRLYKD